VVTEKATSRIDLFPIDDHGHLGAPSSVPSNGATPFGFVFGRNHTLIVDEAAASTLSSYEIQNGGTGLTLRSITTSIPDGGVALCWIVRDGSIAFGVNAGTNSISSLQISPKGELELLDSTAAVAPAGTGPIDTALTNNGDFLYTIGTGNGSLLGYRVKNGVLTQVASLPGLPLSIQGIAAF
jgi:6-phosphogluconolactonase (cycloisomerase 2 family)